MWWPKQINMSGEGLKLRKMMSTGALLSFESLAGGEGRWGVKVGGWTRTLETCEGRWREEKGGWSHSVGEEIRGCLGSSKACFEKGGLEKSCQGKKWILCVLSLYSEKLCCVVFLCFCVVFLETLFESILHRFGFNF